ncbi:hypothetical protein EY04_07220 [Pseudomonas chlororaphis]|nr:hypothetical protein EY04_07220 [Pseudomonas chlororaphis]
MKNIFNFIRQFLKLFKPFRPSYQLITSITHIVTKQTSFRHFHKRLQITITLSSRIKFLQISFNNFKLKTISQRIKIIINNFIFKN